jgi:hypothetical protein
MEPTLLYMKKLDKRMASEKMRTSWLLSSSSAPKPSVSITKTEIGSPSGVKPCIGLPQTQIPYLTAKHYLIIDLELIRCLFFQLKFNDFSSGKYAAKLLVHF